MLGLRFIKQSILKNFVVLILDQTGGLLMLYLLTSFHFLIDALTIPHSLYIYVYVVVDIFLYSYALQIDHLLCSHSGLCLGCNLSQA